DSVERLVQTRHYEEALALLNRLALVVGPEREVSVNAARAAIARQQALDRAITEYNLGVDAVNRKDYLEAGRRLAHARDLAPEGELRARARASLEGIAGLVEYNRRVEAARKNDAAAALAWFEKAYQAAQTEKVKSMAAQRVKELRPRVATQKP